MCVSYPQIVPAFFIDGHNSREAIKKDSVNSVHKAELLEKVAGTVYSIKKSQNIGIYVEQLHIGYVRTLLGKNHID